MGEKLGRREVLFQKMFGAKNNQLTMDEGGFLGGGPKTSSGLSRLTVKERPPQKYLFLGRSFGF